MMTCKILFFSPRTEPKQDPLRPSRTNPRSHWEHLILVKCPLFSPIYIKLQTTNCAVILRYCMSKSDKKCRSYLTLKHSRILNLQFPQFFKGLKRGLLTKIRCSQWLQGMVLDGLKGFQAKKSKSMTFNYKSCISYLVWALV